MHTVRVLLTKSTHFSIVLATTSTAALSLLKIQLQSNEVSTHGGKSDGTKGRTERRAGTRTHQEKRWACIRRPGSSSQSCKARMPSEACLADAARANATHRVAFHSLLHQWR